MRNISMPPQILRLVLLTVVIVGSYLVARYFFTPSSFGQYGHYRGVAMIELASRPTVLAGKKACEECHEDRSQQLAKGAHQTLSCEVCHGAAQAHADNPDIKPSMFAYSHCVRCHEADPAKPKWLKQIASKNHYTGERCAECHIPHSPLEVP